jgi:hypothetical protein
VLFTYGVGVNGLFGLPDNTVLSEKYQTLVTPIGWAFSIWGPIFISEGIYTAVQMLPKYRADPMVTQGVSYYYAATCLAQIFWTFSFSLEVNWLACTLMFSILACLIGLVRSQYKLATESAGKFWLLQFPFQLHLGWIIAASNVNLSVLLVAYGSDNSELQLSVGILSLSAVVAVALYVLFVLEKRLVTTAGVQAWALGGIAAQLKYPFEKTVVEFGQLVLDGVGGAAAIASTILAIIVGLNIVYEIYLTASGKGPECVKDDKNKLPMTLEAPLTGVSTV